MKDKQKKGSFKKPAGKKAAAKKATASKKLARDRKAQLMRRLGKKAGKRAFDFACVSRNMLKSHVAVATFDQVLVEIRNKKIGQPFVRSSQENYLRAISFGLALYLAAQAENDPASRLKQLIQETGQRVTKSTTPELIVMRVVIDYGETKEEKKVGRKFANRDAAALKHLVERGISPEDVVELGKKKGEGLEAWARAKSAAKKTDGSKDEKDAEWRDIPKTQRSPRQPEEMEEDDEWGDESESQAGASKTNMGPLGTIEAIAKKGPVFYPAGAKGDPIWGVVAIKVTGPDTHSQSGLRLALAKELRAYADELTDRNA